MSGDRRQPTRSNDLTPAQASVIVSLALALAALVRWRVLTVPLERDEGEYAYIAQLLLQGIAPYSAAYTMKLPGVPLCRGWRAKFVLPELLALLSGDTAIRVADPRLADPLELVELEPEEPEEPEPTPEPAAERTPERTEAAVGEPEVAPAPPPPATTDATLEESPPEPPEVDPR